MTDDKIDKHISALLEELRELNRLLLHVATSQAKSANLPLPSARTPDPRPIRRR